MENKIDTINRISIFHSLTVSEISDIDMQKLECLLGDHYTDFIDFCESIKQRNDVSSVSCDIESDNIIFKLYLVNGKTESM